MGTGVCHPGGNDLQRLCPSGPQRATGAVDSSEKSKKPRRGPWGEGDRERTKGRGRWGEGEEGRVMGRGRRGEGDGEKVMGRGHWREGGGMLPGIS